MFSSNTSYSKLSKGQKEIELGDVGFKELADGMDRIMDTGVDDPSSLLTDFNIAQLNNPGTFKQDYEQVACNTHGHVRTCT